MPPSSQSTTTTLLQLLPTFGPSTLPPALIDLTGSLYARSRARASILKPEEEIAREYACAVLATERLKTRLNLPEADVRPPCPPKVFNKLLKFLDGILPKTQAGTPAAPPTSRNARATNAATTPDGRKRRRLDALEDTQDTIDNETRERLMELAHWLPDYIVRVGTRFEASKRHFEHSVASGILVIANSKNPAHGPPQATKSNINGPDRIAVLVVAVALLVLESLLYDFDPREAASKAVQELMARRVVTAVHFGTTVSKARGLLEDKADIWKAMPWYRDFQREIAMPVSTINDAVEADIDQDELGDTSVGEDEDGVNAQISLEQDQSEETSWNKKTPAAERLLPRTGLGTMRQPATDWLSPERRQSYIEWKAGIMRRIADTERKGLVVDG